MDCFHIARMTITAGLSKLHCFRFSTCLNKITKWRLHVLVRLSRVPTDRCFNATLSQHCAAVSHDTRCLSAYTTMRLFLALSAAFGDVFPSTTLCRLCCAIQTVNSPSSFSEFFAFPSPPRVGYQIVCCELGSDNPCFSEAISNHRTEHGMM